MEGAFLPVFVVLAIFGILAGFFRKILVRVVVILAVEILLFALFPNLLLYLSDAVVWLRSALSS